MRRRCNQFVAQWAGRLNIVTIGRYELIFVSDSEGLILYFFNFKYVLFITN